VIKPISSACFASDLPSQHQIFRPAQTDESRKTLRRAGARNDAQAELGLTELGAVGRNADVARQRELATAAERVTINRGNGRPWKALDLCEQ
jgi:hypothetical protein